MDEDEEEGDGIAAVDVAAAEAAAADAVAAAAAAAACCSARCCFSSSGVMLKSATLCDSMRRAASTRRD